MKKYIWQNSKYPNFTYDKELIIPLLSSVRLKQGMLLGKMQQLGFENSQYAVLNILTEDVIKSSEIEGLKLNTEQVRSSIAKRLGLDIGDDIYIERDVQGTVDMMLDATQYFDKPLTEDRLFGWQSAMFPSGRSGLYKIKVGEYRDDANGAMQVVSGAVGHEKVHYEAPPANILDKEMKTFLDYINNEKVLNKAEKHTKRADLISPALTKIFEDFNKKITVKELADLCSVSEYHFLRTFKKETGFTAIQYIINYRISLAETLLKTTENTIEEIAYACGFDDVSYFYRCYKKIKGVSPKKSRAQ